MLEAIGLPAFSERAARELAATGERVRRRTPKARDELTEREAQIARLAAAGLSNRGIGQRLYISHRTVGYHLAKVFNKLDVDNRAQLHAVPGDAAAPVSASLTQRLDLTHPEMREGLVDRQMRRRRLPATVLQTRPGACEPTSATLEIAPQGRVLRMH